MKRLWQYVWLSKSQRVHAQREEDARTHIDWETPLGKLHITPYTYIWFSYSRWLVAADGFAER